jgi:hypothetical protein
MGVGRGYADFREFITGEVRRIYLLGRWVNRDANHSEPINRLPPLSLLSPS